MKRWLVLLAVMSCKKPASPPVWPQELTRDWSRLEMKREGRSVALEKKDGAWRLVAPRRGDADPDSVDRLTQALKAPQVLAARELQPSAGAATWDLTIEAGPNRWQVSGTRVGLSNPVVVRIAGVGEFTVAAVEMANQIPDPEDFLTPGLWIAAEHTARTFTLAEGPHPYDLAGEGEDWHLTDGGPPPRDLDDFVGIVVGKQAIGHPQGKPSELGLDPPTARAKVCTASGECRLFAFGKSGEHHYAMAPDSDPIELRASDWNLIVNGP